MNPGPVNNGSYPKNNNFINPGNNNNGVMGNSQNMPRNN
jgi:hypothetical protein